MEQQELGKAALQRLAVTDSSSNAQSPSRLSKRWSVASTDDDFSVTMKALVKSLAADSAPASPQGGAPEVTPTNIDLDNPSKNPANGLEPRALFASP